MTSTAATRISHDQQPGRSDMDEHQRDEYLRTACRAAGQERRAAGEAAHRPSPEDLAAACDRARDAALAALAEAGLDGDEALALAERAARQQDDESEVPARYAEHDASRYPAQVGSIYLAPAGRRLHHHLGTRPGRVQPHPRQARAARRARRLPRRRPHDAARLGRGPGAARPRPAATRRQHHPRGTRACARQRPPVPRRAVLRLMAVPERLPRPARQQEPQADGHVPDARAG